MNKAVKHELIQLPVRHMNVHECTVCYELLRSDVKC